MSCGNREEDELWTGLRKTKDIDTGFIYSMLSYLNNTRPWPMRRWTNALVTGDSYKLCNSDYNVLSVSVAHLEGYFHTGIIRSLQDSARKYSYQEI